MFYRKFLGNKKTSSKFLEDINGMSKDNRSLMDNLNFLNIFSDISINKNNKNKVILTEKPNEAKFTYTHLGNKKFYFNIPNVFQRGEGLKVMCEIDRNTNTKTDNQNIFGEKINAFLDKYSINIKSFLVEGTKPFIYNVFNNKSLFKSTLLLSKKETKINEEIFQVTDAKCGLSTQNYNLLGGIERINSKMYKVSENSVKFLGFDINIKLGCDGNVGNGKRKEIIKNEENNREIKPTDNLLDKTMLKNSNKDLSQTNNVKKYAKIAKDIFDKQLNMFFKDTLSSLFAKNNINNPFIKFNASKKIRKECNYAYLEMFGEIGKIFLYTDNTTESESEGTETNNNSIFNKYFATIRGYKRNAITPIENSKKQGGSTFLKFIVEGGIKLTKKLHAFGFVDTAACTDKPLVATLKQLDDRESTCIGRSIGLGIKIKDAVSFVYAVPLTKSIETEKFQFNMDMKF